MVVAAFVALVAGVVGFFWYFGSPKWTDVGYRPAQPVPFSHKLHAGDLGLDCRYCHFQVERSTVANVPTTQTCLNCHTLILPQSEKLLPIRESWADGQPMRWVRVHKLPDYAYFDHSAHLRAGVGCVECHGRIDQMPVVTQAKPLSMGWCLECHRNPTPHLRPVREITNMSWAPSTEPAAASSEPRPVAPPLDCSGCHR